MSGVVFFWGFFKIFFVNNLPCTCIICLSPFLSLCSVASNLLVSRSKGKQLTASYFCKCPQNAKPGWRPLLLVPSLGDTCDACVLFCCPSPPGAKELSQRLVSHAHTPKGDRWELWSPNGLETGGVGQGGASEQKVGVQVCVCVGADGFPWAQGTGGTCRARSTQWPSTLPVTIQ